MNKLMTLPLISLTALLFCLSATAAESAAPDIKTVLLIDADSKALAHTYVQNSACIQIYEIKTRNTGVIDTHVEGVAQAMLLRSKADHAQFFRIFSDERGGKGYGLMEVGAFSLPRCEDYQEL